MPASVSHHRRLKSCWDFRWLIGVLVVPLLSRHKGWGCQPGAWRTLKALKTLILKLKKGKKAKERASARGLNTNGGVVRAVQTEFCLQ